MNEGQLARRLIEKNPWWRSEAWEVDDPDLRGLRGTTFDYRPNPLAGIRPDGLYLLNGPRRVGKSVELKRAVASLIEAGIEPRRVIFFSCDGMTAGDLGRAFRVGRNLSRTLEGPRYWLLDEVTSVDGWAKVVKDERDGRHLRDDCVVVTGSSSRDLQEAGFELAGRHGDVLDTERLLLPMSFRAFCRAIGITDIPSAPPIRPRDVFDSKDRLAELEVSWPELEDAWQSYLRIGGFPRSVRGFVETGAVPLSFIRDIRDVIRGEAFRTLSMNGPETTALLARLALSLTATINASDMARDLDIGTNHQVEGRITALTSAFLGFRCYQDDKGAPNLNAQRKFYFTDPLLARLAHLLDDAYGDPDDSRVNEQQVALALHRAIERERPGSFIDGSEVRYWVNKVTRAEIDFVGARLGTGYEVKYVDSGWRGASKSLLAKGGGGVVVTRSVFSIDHTDAIAVPSGLLVWLIDG